AAREAIGKRDIAEEIAACGIAIVLRAQQVISEFQVVPAAEPGEMLLQLLRMSAVSGAGVIGLRDAPQPNAGPADVQQTADVGQVGREAYEAEILRHLRPI